MKNGCNFHALQVKSNYKIFSEKIEPKKDACRMAIKIKGKLPLKICSVLFVLYGAASLVALLLCLIDRKYVEEYDLSAYFNSSMPVLSVAGAMLVPVLLLIAGLIFNWTALVWAGILLFGLVTVFQLATLPVEFNASRRALAAIESRNLLTDDELRGARSVLRAAAMTYVAALLVSFAQLLRLILLYGNRRRD